MRLVALSKHEASGLMLTGGLLFGDVSELSGERQGGQVVSVVLMVVTFTGAKGLGA